MERTLLVLAATAAVVVAVAVSVIAAAYALFLAVAPVLGVALAALTVAVAALLLAGVIGVIAARRVQASRLKSEQSEADGSLADVALRFVQKRPLLSAGAAVAAGIYAMRNPQMAAAVIRAFTDRPSGNRN
ncbi:MAG: hypothetical protein Q8L66_06090 [Caulobacter sp.]|nr:hypothetical protein [Caulobacter sp.]